MSKGELLEAIGECIRLINNEITVISEKDRKKYDSDDLDNPKIIFFAVLKLLHHVFEDSNFCSVQEQQEILTKCHEQMTAHKHFETPGGQLQVTAEEINWRHEKCYILATYWRWWNVMRVALTRKYETIRTMIGVGGFSSEDLDACFKYRIENYGEHEMMGSVFGYGSNIQFYRLFIRYFKTPEVFFAYNRTLSLSAMYSKYRPSFIFEWPAFGEHFFKLQGLDLRTFPENEDLRWNLVSTLSAPRVILMAAERIECFETFQFLCEKEPGKMLCAFIQRVLTNKQAALFLFNKFFRNNSKLLFDCLMNPKSGFNVSYMLSHAEIFTIFIQQINLQDSLKFLEKRLHHCFWLHFFWMLHNSGSEASEKYKQEAKAIDVTQFSNLCDFKEKVKDLALQCVLVNNQDKMLEFAKNAYRTRNEFSNKETHVEISLLIEILLSHSEVIKYIASLYNTYDDLLGIDAEAVCHPPYIYLILEWKINNNQPLTGSVPKLFRILFCDYIERFEALALSTATGKAATVALSVVKSNDKDGKVDAKTADTKSVVASSGGAPATAAAGSVSAAGLSLSPSATQNFSADSADSAQTNSKNEKTTANNSAQQQAIDQVFEVGLSAIKKLAARHDADGRPVEAKLSDQGESVIPPLGELLFKMINAAVTTQISRTKPAAAKLATNNLANQTAAAGTAPSMAQISSMPALGSPVFADVTANSEKLEQAKKDIGDDAAAPTPKPKCG